MSFLRRGAWLVVVLICGLILGALVTAGLLCLALLWIFMMNTGLHAFVEHGHLAMSIGAGIGAIVGLWYGGYGIITGLAANPVKKRNQAIE